MKFIQRIILIYFLYSTITVFASGTEEIREISSSGVENGPRFVLTLKPGSQYSKTINYIVYKYTVYPQVAVWIETMDGDYLETLFVTAKSESGEWQAAPENGRPEALPVWFHLNNNEVDAVSSATSTGETSFGSSIGNLPNGTYRILLETNRSYDYNKSYPKKLGVNGQPSIIYESILEIGKQESKNTFSPIGRGSQDGTNGDISEGLEGIDTALELFSYMGVSYIP